MGLVWPLLPPYGMGHEWKVMLWSFPTLVSLLIFRKVDLPWLASRGRASESNG